MFLARPKRILRWDIPDGEWLIQAFIESDTGQQVKRATLGMEGNVLDHHSREAMALFLRSADRVMDAVRADPVRHAGLAGLVTVWRRGETSSPELPQRPTTAGDALWYVIVTMSTVGYGDRYPVTEIGRMFGVVIIVVGVGVFGTLTGFLANAFLSPSDAAADHESEATPERAPMAEVEA